MNLDKVWIKFYVGGREYAVRRWHQVPRVGDEIMLRDPANPAACDKYGKRAFSVKRIVWGVESEQEERDGWQAANVEIERKP